MTNFERYLGRLPEYDPRSHDYPIRAFLFEDTVRSYTWSVPITLDQGRPVDGRKDVGTCVGHSWAHEVAARPVVRSSSSELALKLYDYAQQHDEWDGAYPLYSGTSVLAGAKAMRHLGYCHEYRWALSAHDALVAIGRRGPGVAGTWWWSGMFEPDSTGRIRPTGYREGGHAYLLNAVNKRSGKVWVYNSWGASWGNGGRAWMTFDDWASLFDDGGEFCIPTRRGGGNG